MDSEVWREIPGWPAYAVSDVGRIKRIAPGSGAVVGRLLSLIKSKRGYLVVRFKKGPKQFTHSVHSLVALAFIGPRPPGKEVCHGNGQCLDNRAANLRYGTRSENVVDTILHGTARTGERHPLVVSPDAVILAALRDAAQIGTAPAARRHGVNRTTLHDVLTGKSRAYLLERLRGSAR